MTRRDIRRLAMQLLYELDVRSEEDWEAIRSRVEEDQPTELREAAANLAHGAWQSHEQADALASELAPTWPTRRQPAVDRAILRLGYHEMASGYSPPSVAINEAVELAKQFGAEQSPAFVNGVLDKMAKRLADDDALPEAEPAPEPPESADRWLRDATGEN